jgi:hypothetical protein
MIQLAPEMKFQQPKLKNAGAKATGTVLKRRMLDLLPDERFARTRITVSSGATIVQQLLNFEGQRLTGCLKVEAPRFMSRAGILIVRGKVLACVYGSKSLPCQLFGQTAFKKVTTEITHPDNILDSYLLPEDIAVASGSMFHGQLTDLVSSAPAKTIYSILERFDKENASGSIALLDYGERPRCLTYFAKRRFIGSQSLCDQAPPESFTELIRYLRDRPESQVLGSMLNLDRSGLMQESMVGLIPRLNYEKPDATCGSKSVLEEERTEPRAEQIAEPRAGQRTGQRTGQRPEQRRGQRPEARLEERVAHQESNMTLASVGSGILVLAGSVFLLNALTHFHPMIQSLQAIQPPAIQSQATNAQTDQMPTKVSQLGVAEAANLLCWKITSTRTYRKDKTQKPLPRASKPLLNCKTVLTRLM